MESVPAFSQAETDDMFLVVTGRAIQHIEGSVPVGDARVASDQILPRMVGAWGQNGISRILLQFHI